jgi:hypothetical protein
VITSSGIGVWPDVDPSKQHGNDRSNSSDDVVYGGAPSLFDIGTGLSRTARFAGQTKIWYNVLAHVLTVADLLPENFRFYGLIHDAAESIVGDQVTTWKNLMTKADENVVMGRICHSLGVEFPFPREIQDQVDWADRACLRAEAEVLGHGDAQHDYFINVCPEVPRAYELTGIRSQVPCGDWLEYGRGGDLYESEVRAAMKVAVGLGGVGVG